MKKITLFLMACIMSFTAFAAGGNITYVLNGGVTNDYGWQSKSDMFDAFKSQANPSFAWQTLDYYMKQADPLGAPNICSGLTSCVILNTDAAKWGWLKTYVINVTTSQLTTTTPAPTALAVGDDLSSANWRYAVGAFFASFWRTGWPATANYTLAGLPEAFIPAWGHAFAGPATYDGTVDIVIPAPYKAGFTFDGWYKTSDFSGAQVTSISTGTAGDITLYAKWIEYIPTCAEVWALGAGKSTSASGVVTYVNGGTAYIQDASAGLLVEFATIPAIAAGDKITLKGTTAALGEYVKITGATLSAKETATLPTASIATLSTLATYIFKYISIEGLTITAINGSNITLSDGTTTTALVADGVTYPVNTKVNLKATVTFTDTIGLVGYSSGVTKAPLAGKDTATYVAMGDKGQYTLTSKWLISRNMDNYTANPLGSANMIRDMAVKGGKMYFPDREKKQLVVVDGATGEKLDPVTFSSDVFDGIAMPYNDLKLDSKGNFLSSSLTTSGTSPFQVWKLNPETHNGKLIINSTMNNYPDYAGIAFRFDYIGVYGDVDNDAVILAHNGGDPTNQSLGTMNVYKWTVKGGVAGDPEEIAIDTSEPGTFLFGITQGRTAAQVVPVDNNYFYLDLFNSLPTLIDMDGNIVDGFHNYADGASMDTPNQANNGVVEFEMGGEYFLIMAYMTPTSSFRMFKFKDANKEFKDITPLWIFPTKGMGSSSNSYRTAMPCVEVNEATKTATIYMFVGENGYGVYEFKIGAGSGIQVVNSDAVTVGVSGNRVMLSESVASIKVYNLMGQLLEKAQGVSSINIPNQGIYIVTLQTLKGDTVTKKVIIK